MSSSIISLGSGQILPWESHPSLSLLHQLKLFSFPIPTGVILLNPDRTHQTFETDLLQNFINELQSYEIRNEIEVTFFIPSHEKGTYQRSGKLSELREILIELNQKVSSDHPELKDRIDILVQENMNERQEGIKGWAISESGYADDLIHFEIISNENPFPALEVTTEKLFLGESRIRGDFRGRVQDLLRSIRRALGEDGWKIDWFDDGQQIFLKTILKHSVVYPRRDSYLPSTFFSLIPISAGALRGQLISELSTKLFQYFSHWTPELSSDRGWVTYLNHELRFNRSLVHDFLRSFGLFSFPIRICFDSDTSPIQPLNGVRFWRNLPRMIRLLHELSLGPGIAIRLEKKLSSFSTEPDKTVIELLSEWQNIFIATSHVLYRLWGSLFLQTYFSAFPFQRNVISAEQRIRQTAIHCLKQIEQALEIKALGWYSRGLIRSTDEIWSLSKEDLLKLDQQNFDCPPEFL